MLKLVYFLILSVDNNYLLKLKKKKKDKNIQFIIWVLS